MYGQWTEEETAFGVIYFPHRKRYRNFVDVSEVNFSNFMMSYDESFCFSDLTLVYLNIILLKLASQ